MTGSLHTFLVSLEFFALGHILFRAWLKGFCALYHPTLVQCHSGQDPWDLTDPTPLCFKDQCNG